MKAATTKPVNQSVKIETSSSMKIGEGGSVLRTLRQKLEASHPLTGMGREQPVAPPSPDWRLYAQNQPVTLGFLIRQVKRLLLQKKPTAATCSLWLDEPPVAAINGNRLTQKRTPLTDASSISAMIRMIVP